MYFIPPISHIKREEETQTLEYLMGFKTPASSSITLTTFLNDSIGESLESMLSGNWPKSLSPLPSLPLSLMVFLLISQGNAASNDNYSL